MSSGPQISEAEAIQAAEYVLGLMAAADRRAFELKLAQSQPLRDEVAGWEEDFVALISEVVPVDPGAHAAVAVQERLFGATSRRARFMAYALPWRWAAGAALAVALSLVLVALGDQTLPTDSAPASYVSDIVSEDGALQVVALYSAGTGTLRLNRTRGAPQSGRSFQLWLIAGQDAPVSLGVMPDSTQFQLEVPNALHGAMPGAVLAISDEAAGGSADGLVAGPILAAAAIHGV